MPRVEDVTVAAQTAKGTFYSYFASWDEFLTAVRNSLLEDYASAMRERMSGIDGRNYWRRFEQEVLHYIRWTKAQDLLHRRLFHAGSTADFPPGVSASDLIESVLQIGISAGLVRAGLRMEVVAPLVFETIHAAAALATPANLDDVSRSTYDYIRAAVEQR